MKTTAFARARGGGGSSLRFEPQQIAHACAEQAQPTNLQQRAPADSGMVLTMAAEAVHEKIPASISPIGVAP
jgi:hypothetical protein